LKEICRNEAGKKSCGLPCQDLKAPLAAARLMYRSSQNVITVS
jgi:hypothetical protein